MQFATAGAARMGVSELFTPKNTQFIHKLTGADVMSWKPKSRLQQLFDRLVKAATQAGRP